MRLIFSYMILVLAILTTGQTVFAEEPLPEASLDKKQGYVSCGCGCCSGLEPDNRCLYKNNGDSLEKIIEEDKKKASDTEFCATVGCSLPVRYQYCDTPSDPPFFNPGR
jgi:hypothetical protein